MKMMNYVRSMCVLSLVALGANAEGREVSRIKNHQSRSVSVAAASAVCPCGDGCQCATHSRSTRVAAGFASKSRGMNRIR